MRARILALAPNPWEGQWMNRQQILSRLAGRHDIVYSNGPWTVWDRDDPRWRRAPHLGGFRQRDGVWVDDPPRWLLSWPTRPRWDGLVHAACARRWRRRLERLGGAPVVAWLFHPSLIQHAEALRPDRLIYHPFDLFTATPGWKAQHDVKEEHALARADLIITSSEAARTVLAGRSGRTVHWVPNGVDADAFAAAAAAGEAPPDLEAIPRPRLGYVGSINRKVDFPLIEALALREPSWQFVFVGPVFGQDETTAPALERCRSLPNIHFLPARSHRELPATMAALDVGLMCYRTETWAQYGYPLKLHEYLATGLPVVSTALPAVTEFSGLVRIAAGEQDWHEALEAAIAGEAPGSRETRQAEAAMNTWDNRVGRIAELLDRTLLTA